MNVHRSPLSVFFINTIAAITLGCTGSPGVQSTAGNPGKYENTRTIRTVELPPMTFESDRPKLPGSIRVCIPRQLSSRQWNVERHPFRINLGARASVNFERLTIAAFEDVKISTSVDCGSTSESPHLTARIVSANREHYTDVKQGRQRTSIQFEMTLFSADGNEVWRSRVEGVDESEPAYAGASPFGHTPSHHVEVLPAKLLEVVTIPERSKRHEDAAIDFGVALANALEQSFEALLSSPEVRAALSDDDSNAHATTKATPL